MTHPCEVHVSEAIDALWRASLPEQVAQNQKLVNGVYFSWDEVNATVDLTLEPLADGMLGIRARVTGEPSWFSLNLSLGPGSFEPNDVIGFVAELCGSTEFAVAPVIRSLDEEGTRDTVCREQFQVPTTPQVLTLLHTVEAGDRIVAAKNYHTLIIPLPKSDFALDIMDLRLFVVPATRALRAGPARLAAWAP